MNYTEVRTAFHHDLKLDAFALEIFSGINERLLLLADLVEKELMRRNPSYLKNRTLFWKTGFWWSKNKDIQPRIDARVDLLDNRDLEPARIPVLSAGFCDDIKITDDTPKSRGLAQLGRFIANAIEARHNK